jgi:metallopeptidase MepB
MQEKLRQLFHELGHAMHNLLSKTLYARFHGTSVNTDFVEVPSVLFEHILWNAPIMQDLSSHYSHISPSYMASWEAERAQNGKEVTKMPLKISEEIVEKLLKAKEVNNTMNFMGTVFMSTFDMAVHSQSTGDRTLEELASLYKEIRGDITGLDEEEAQSYGFATFRGIMGNYDAGYYTYVM